MKIEKLNDQQIRCTLTREDLAVRHIKLSELAYGSEKTRELFQDMMDQAATDFGFDVEDIPLMVEAIPMSSEQIVLIITKVEAPDELDTRFSEFSHFREEIEPEEESEDDSQAELDLPQDLLDLLNQIRTELTESGESPAHTAERPAQEEEVCLYVFDDIDDAIPAAAAISETFTGDSTLYRDAGEGEYLLFIHQGIHSPMEFNRICHTMSSYLARRRCTSATEAYLREHGRVILPERAVETLVELSV